MVITLPNLNRFSIFFTGRFFDKFVVKQAINDKLKVV